MNFYEQIFSRGRATGEGMTHFERLFAAKFGGSPPPEVREYTGAVPVTITADGSPLLDYLITGNTTQSGTPTPENPVMPQGTGERTGNLYNINAKDVNNGYVNNARLNQDGTTAAWGSTEISEYIPISGDTAYTFNGIGSYNAPCYGLYDENKQLIGAYRYNGASIIKFTSPNNARYFRFTHIKAATRAMMVEGAYTTSTMPDYEPYGIKIPILSADTTTPVYLGEVETTRRIRKLVFDGSENWRQSSDGNIYIALSPNQGVAWTLVLSTHFTSSQVQTNGGLLWFVNAAVDFDTVEECKTYLAAQYAAGTPVCVWYVLATPQTAVVNEPLMKIGDYADTLSKEQAGANIPTNNGSTTVDVDTTVKPSEVYIKYMG